jgi:hypothetical protein
MYVSAFDLFTSFTFPYGMAGGSVPKKRGCRVSVAVATDCVEVGGVPVIVTVDVNAVPVSAVLVSVVASVIVSVTAGTSVSVAVGIGVSVAGSKVGVGSAFSVSTEWVSAIAASVACVSTAEVGLGCCSWGNAGMQALKRNATVNTRTAVLFITDSFISMPAR